ncbi:MAG: hypothetical protein J6O56_02300 [Bacilli bacterium]|nr:hypothetical protein [Bacilli bacterium]
MIKNFIESIKLSRLSYLLEVIEVRDFRSKINAYNKIRKMKITKDMGLLILNETDFDHHNTYSDFNISLSLISLLFENYYDEYSDKLKEIYPKLTLESKYEVLNLLAFSDNKSAITLYKDLLVKYGKELDDIPIGNLASSKEKYDLIFPDLYKTLKYDIKRNNVLLLINEFFINGAAKEVDVKKHKKLISDSITKILREAVNYKFKKDENIMQNKDYINLRIFLEAICNIEFYVSTKDTKNYLEKLLKKKDNQLKLFILENYIKKGKDISKISLNSIAKDNLSRYPLYSFLKFYNLERLMPKKYANNISLGESDLYINYCINYKYESIPENIEYVDERVVKNLKYYIYKFETKFNYKEEIKDIATDYILKNTEIDKTIKENAIVNYIGLSGGFNKDLDPSLIENGLDKLYIKKYVGDYTKLIDELLPKKDLSISIDVLKEKLEKVNEKKPKEKKKFILFKKKDKVKNVKTEKIEKVVEDIDEDIEKEPSLLRRIFSFNTLLILIFFAFAGSVFVLVTYLNGMDILDMKNTSNDYTNLKVLKSISLKDDRFKEISYDAIWNQGQSEYYVLFYNKKNKSIYNSYLKTILDNNYIVYFVDTKKEENKKIFEGNPTGFIIEKDTWLKVKDKEYEFYVVGKTNILKELRDYVDVINKKKAEEEKKLKKEKENKKNKESISVNIDNFFNSKAKEKKISKNTCRKSNKKRIDFYTKKIYNLNINVEKEE